MKSSKNRSSNWKESLHEHHSRRIEKIGPAGHRRKRPVQTADPPGIGAPPPEGLRELGAPVRRGRSAFGRRSGAGAAFLPFGTPAGRTAVRFDGPRGFNKSGAIRGRGSAGAGPEPFPGPLARKIPGFFTVHIDRGRLFGASWRPGFVLPD